MARSLAIGIDLGTTNTCVGVFRHGRVDIIPNDQGNRKTPSCVAFTNSQRHIGEVALNQAAINSKNTICDVKRLIGRNFQDEEVKKDMKHWLFGVIEDNGNPKVQIQFKGETRQFFPEEISSMILRKIKRRARLFLKQEVTKAVITVPAYFNDSQRQATKDAAKIAGLEVLRIINEPTAAAIAHKLLNKPNNQNFLIFDFGGGTIDVSILNIKNKRIVVKSTGGYTHLGGKDIDDILVDQLKRIFKERDKKDISNDQKALARLRIAAERAKIALSDEHTNKTSVDIDFLVDGTDFSYVIHIREFNEWCKELFQSTLTYVDKALREAKMEKSEIHEVILVGGSSRIPKVQQLLQEFFNGMELNKSVNLDEAVAEGAAFYAAILNGVSDAELKGLKFKDVNPMPLGLMRHDGKLDVIIAKNSSIPCTRDRIAEMIGTEALIKVFEGEKPMVEDNDILCSIHLNSKDHPKLYETSWYQTSKVQLDIRFIIDEDGILNASVRNRGNNFPYVIPLERKKCRSVEQLDQLKKNAQTLNAELKEEREREEALTRTEMYCNDMMLTMCSSEIPDFCKNSAIAACEGVLDWISQNKLAKKEEIEIRENHLKKTCEASMDTISKLKISIE